MQRPTTLLVAISVIAAALTSSADARDRSGFVRENRFRESLRGEQWREALTLFSQFKDRQRTGHLTYLAAQAHVQLKEYQAGGALLQGLLEIRSDNLEALYLLARVRAKQHEMELAKQLLLEAARAGQQVARDIEFGEGKELFGGLKRDPRFVLELMRASQACQFTNVSELRNPFRPPAKDWKKPKPKLGGTPAEITQRLEREIGALFQEIGAHAEAEQLEPLLIKLGELRGLIGEFKEQGVAAAKAKLRTFQTRFRRYDDLAASIQLNVNVAEGNLHLKLMAKHYAAAEYAKTVSVFARLETLCETMRRHPRDVFSRNAEALHERGRRMRDAAQVRVEIETLELKLTGIVVPAPEESGKAIVNDRIHAEGDPVFNPTTREDHAELTLVKVAPGRVTFRYRGVPFIRVLERGDPRPK